MNEASGAIASFTLLDWVVLAIVLYSVVMSTLRGFVRELMGLVTVAAGFFLASWFYRDLGQWFTGVVQTENLALFIGFALVFGGVTAAGYAAIWAIYRFFRFARIEWFDRLLGGAFGFVRGWLVAAVLFLGLTSFGVQTEAVRNSQLAPYLLPAARIAAAVTPMELRSKFMVGYEQVRLWWSQIS